MELRFRPQLGGKFMKIATLVRFLGLAVLLMVLPQFASAAKSVKCESNDMRRNYCGNFGPRQIQLDRQISRSPCIPNESWGVDERGLWVDRGCRAIFAIRKGGRGGYGGGWNNRDSINLPNVAVDTGGEGGFRGPGSQGFRVTRGWVDTRGQDIALSLSGQGMKITFFGRAVRQNGDREYVMEIYNSDRGNVNGSATFRFNPDRNEVEYIELNGQMNGGGISGIFSRSH
jgi:hypothetical protein